MFNQDTFGDKLKTIRKEKNLTQEEVAEKIGVSGQAVSKWEKGECLPDVYNLKLLARLYRMLISKEQCDIWELFSYLCLRKALRWPITGHKKWKYTIRQNTR